MLVDELTGALFPIADDVKIQVEWNPAAVAEYRLIGYETRALRARGFQQRQGRCRRDRRRHRGDRDLRGHAGRQPGDAERSAALPAAAGAGGDASELGFLRLRYKAPGATDSSADRDADPGDAGAEVGDEQRFAVAIAGFGQLLRGSTTWATGAMAIAIALANGAKGADPFGYRAEAVQLMRLAQGLSAN